MGNAEYNTFWFLNGRFYSLPAEKLQYDFTNYLDLFANGYATKKILLYTEKLLNNDA